MIIMFNNNRFINFKNHHKKNNSSKNNDNVHKCYHLVPTLCTLYSTLFHTILTTTYEEVLLFFLFHICRNINMNHLVSIYLVLV